MKSETLYCEIKQRINTYLSSYCQSILGSSCKCSDVLSTSALITCKVMLGFLQKKKDFISSGMIFHWTLIFFSVAFYLLLSSV